MEKMWRCLSTDFTQELCELSHARSKLRIISRRKTSSRTPMRMPTRHSSGGYRKRVVKAARNRSFHPEKLCCATFDWAIHRVGSTGRSKKKKSCPHHLRSLAPAVENREMQKLTTGLNELVKHVFFARARNQWKVAFYWKRRRRPQ